MELNDVQIRILGCLVEKQRTTPDNYPLSSNALVNACNQSSNRDPVVHYDERTIDSTMLELRTEGLARTVTGGRTNKHKHVLDEAWGVSEAEVALLAVLFLRGPQTVGELRTRTERMQDFESLSTVERTLDSLTARTEPFVVHLERLPGHKERRWTHLLRDESQPEQEFASAAVHSGSSGGGARSTGRNEQVAELEAQVAQLRSDVDRLYSLLGESPAHE